ncbi:MAG: HAMP domain-containing histidine kinase, partial [Deltaproteobacteria bacterium]|nr:HAMP domain-containing histidine kinase [Deltaproteobacteria bacterium]
AERMGRGELDDPVAATSRDEVGLVADTMEQMRQQLRARDERMQMMLAGIAHEVRNPLAGMELYAGLLRDELPDGDERRAHVAKIEREVKRLATIVNDFLEYARRPKPELADVPLPDLLAEVAQLASTPELTVAVAPDAPALARADRGQLRRALLNLARNAVQAATAAGHTGSDAVRLSGKLADDRLVLSVWNRGKEIPAETSGKLFEPFYTTREKGTGLGLAFARDIAADHGGTIELESANGETTFSIVLPV